MTKIESSMYPLTTCIHLYTGESSQCVKDDKKKWDNIIIHVKNLIKCTKKLLQLMS
jgi:hypothetical protein